MDWMAEYLRLRAKHPDYSRKSLLQWAKSTAKRARLDWDEKSSASIGRITMDGFDIVVKIRDDDDYDYADEFGHASNKYERVDGGRVQLAGRRRWITPEPFENPTWREYHKGEECHSYERHCPGRYFYHPSGETFAAMWAYNTKTMGRHDAWLRTMEWFREAAEDLRKAENGNPPWYVMLVTATAYVDGEEIATTSVGGYSWQRDYTKPLEPQLDEIASEVLSEVIAEAEDALTRRADELRREAETKMEIAQKLEAMNAR